MKRLGPNGYIALSIWAYSVLFAVMMGSSIPSFVQSLPIDVEGTSTGVLLIFVTIPGILFFGVARAGWSDDRSKPNPGFFSTVFGEERATKILTAVRPATLLMIVTGLIGGIGVASTFMSTRSPVSYCLSSYFLAVGLGHVYAYLVRNRCSKNPGAD